MVPDPRAPLLRGPLSLQLAPGWGFRVGTVLAPAARQQSWAISPPVGKDGCVNWQEEHRVEEAGATPDSEAHFSSPEPWWKLCDSILEKAPLDMRCHFLFAWERGGEKRNFLIFFMFYGRPFQSKGPGRSILQSRE